MTAASHSRRCALMNAYVARIPCDLRRLLIGHPLVLTTTQKVYVKAWEVWSRVVHRSRTVNAGQAPGQASADYSWVFLLQSRASALAREASFEQEWSF
jgi:hypothetical protein